MKMSPPKHLSTGKKKHHRTKTFLIDRVASHSRNLKFGSPESSTTKDSKLSTVRNLKSKITKATKSKVRKEIGLYKTQLF